MKYLLNIILMSLFCLLISCNEDEIIQSVNIDQGTPTIVVGKSSLIVYVEDNNGPQQGIDVNIGGVIRETNEDGRAVFEEISISKNGNLLEIDRTGYAPVRRILYLEPGKKNIRRILLLDHVSYGRRADMDVDISGNGYRIVIPANSLEDEDGVPFTGAYILSVSYLPGNDKNLQSSFSDAYVNLRNDKKNILSNFGILNVELRDGFSNRPLNLREGKTASIEFNIPNEMLSNAPDVIPAFWMNESDGFWEEEGQAQRVGAKYNLEVKHFTYWACMLYQCIDDLVYVTASFENTNGGICAGCYVDILADSYYEYRVRTSSTGSISFLSCAQTDHDFTIHSNDFSCSNQSTMVGTYTTGDTDTDFGTIIYDDNAIVVSGSVRGCDNNLPSPDAYVLLDGQEIIELDGDGNFSIPLCFPSGTSITLRAFDMQGMYTSALETVVLNASGNSDISLVACQESEVFMKVWRNDTLVNDYGGIVQNHIVLDNESFQVSIGSMPFVELFSANVNFEASVDIDQPGSYFDVPVITSGPSTSTTIYAAPNPMGGWTGLFHDGVIEEIVVDEYDDNISAQLEFNVSWNSETHHYRVEFKIVNE